MKFNSKIAVLLFTLANTVIISQGCRQRSNYANNVSVENSIPPDTAKIVVDESLRPIVDEELYIFKSAYPTLYPEVTYAPENDAVNLLINYKAEVAVLFPRTYQTGTDGFGAKKYKADS